MQEHKYKVGDKVRVKTHMLAGWNTVRNGKEYFNERMLKMQGKVFTIIGVTNETLGYEIFVEGEGRSWYFCDEWLEPANNDIVTITVDTTLDWKAEAIRLALETDMKWRAIARQLGKGKSTVRDLLVRTIGTKAEVDAKKALMQLPPITSTVEFEDVGWEDNPSTLSGITDKFGRPIEHQQQQIEDMKILFEGGKRASKSTAYNKWLDSQKMTPHYIGWDLSWDEKEPPKKKPTILVIADTQCKPTESLDYMTWIGKYIADKEPDVVVHIGDHWDFPSLSSYDVGKLSAEGRRLSDDIEAGNNGLLEITKYFKEGYNPRLVFTLGNHCNRLDRYVQDNPQLHGTLGTRFLPLEANGWEVYPFLMPVEIEGIFFSHYFANPMTGKPYGGTASNILKTIGRSFVMGHRQVLDVAMRPTIDGRQQIGIINGAAYPFFEDYKGYFGNNHFRGLTVLHEVSEGFGSPMFVSIDYLRDKYNL